MPRSRLNRQRRVKMAKIDVSYTAKADPQGRRLFKDTETGLCEWEVLPGEDEL